MTTVHVHGASGYAGAETIRFLRAHPRVSLGTLESASHAGEPVGDHLPYLRTLDRCFDAPGALFEALGTSDIVVLAGAHGAARDLVPRVLARGARAIDLSADFRLHPSDAIYGFPERYRDAIANADLIANPGCYPTATLLATLPLAPVRGLRHLVVDAKSGVSGAGRTPAVGSLFAEVSDDIRAYGLDGHRHEPEILQELAHAGIHASLTFTPHVVPLSRGMLVDVYALFDAPVDAREIAARYEEMYASNPFVRLLDGTRAPSLPAVAGTNDAEVHVSVRDNIVRAICAIDNLGKGAAGQAVQNLNLMCGFSEETGLVCAS